MGNSGTAIRPRTLAHRSSRRTDGLSLLVGLILGGVFGASGCSVTTGPMHLNLAPTVARPDRAAVIFLVDGMDRQRMRELLAAGRLPNMQRRFAEGGVAVENAVTSMPALTYPNLVSLLTGRFPGHHGILGNQWFDRSTLQIQDYLTVNTYQSVGQDYSCPTIFEMLNDRFTVNIQCPARRGMSRTADNTLLTGCDWLFGTYTFVDARVGSDIAWAAQAAHQAGQWPSLVVHYFPGVDEIGHRFGADSHRYARALENVDEQIGRVMDALAEAGLADRTYFVLAADHGHVPLPRRHRAGIVDHLRESKSMRIRTALINHSDPVERAEELEDYDAIVVDSGYRRCAIHLPGPGGWKTSPTREKIELLVGSREALPGLVRSGLAMKTGVALVAYRDGEAVRIVSATGSARVEHEDRGSERMYRWVVDAPPGIDPLGYDAAADLKAFVDSGWHTSRDWLTATAMQRFPDFVPQVVEMFESPRAGDIVVFADDDWGLGHRDDGGHGSCLARDMNIPLYFVGPDLPKGGRIGCGRLVDITPTVLDFLGTADRARQYGPLDGVSLADELRQASQAP